MSEPERERTPAEMLDGIVETWLQEDESAAQNAAARYSPEARERLRAALADAETMAASETRVRQRLGPMQARRRRLAGIRRKLHEIAGAAGDPALRLRALFPAATAPARRSLVAENMPAMEFGPRMETAPSPAQPPSAKRRLGFHLARARQSVENADGRRVAAEEQEHALQAESVLQANGIDSAPVDLEALAEGLGLAVQEAGLDRLAGCLATDGQLGGILLDRHLVGGPRRRFLLAHEIAHFLLHAHLGAIEDLPENLDDYTTPQEREANLLALHLLLPTFLLPEEARSRPPTMALAERVAARFEVALETALRRLVRQSSATCALAIVREGQITQCERSAALAGELRENQPVDRASAAAQLATAPEGTVATAELPAAVWLAGLPPGTRLREESRRMEDGSVLSVLTLR